MSFDPAMLQGTGAFLGGLAAFGTLVAGIWNRTRLRSFFEDRFLLVESANDARKRAETAERLALDYEKSVGAMRTTLAALEERLQRLELVESKFDLLVPWVVEVIGHVEFLERAGIAAGADLSGSSMPPVPSGLAKDITIPKDLR